MNLNCDASVMLAREFASLKDLQRDIIKTEMNDDAPWASVEKKAEKIIGHTHKKTLRLLYST